MPEDKKPWRGFISIAPCQPQAHVGFIMFSPHISTSKRLHKSPANISGRWNIYDVQNTSTTQQPHVRLLRTWGYRGATSATWQTMRRFGKPKTKSSASFFGFSLNLQYLWIRYAAFRQTKNKKLRFFFWVFSQLAVSLQTK